MPWNGLLTTSSFFFNFLSVCVTVKLKVIDRSERTGSALLAGWGWVSESPLVLLRGAAFETDLGMLGKAFRKLYSSCGEKQLGCGRIISAVAIGRCHLIRQHKSFAPTTAVNLACWTGEVEMIKFLKAVFLVNCSCSLWLYLVLQFLWNGEMRN